MAREYLDGHLTVSIHLSASFYEDVDQETL
jgi:hypothetical protein